MKRVIFFLALFCAPFAVFGQPQNGFSRSELGVMVGTSYYIGDLNQFRHFRDAKLAGGLFYRYNVNPRVAIRGTANFLRVAADDADAKLTLLQERNLNFKAIKSFIQEQVDWVVTEKNFKGVSVVVDVDCQ